MGIIEIGTGSREHPVRGWTYNVYRAVGGLMVRSPIEEVWCAGIVRYRSDPREGDISGSQWRPGDAPVYETEGEAVSRLIDECDAWWVERRADILRSTAP